MTRQPSTSHAARQTGGVTVEAIPAELRALDQWVVWRYAIRDGKKTKPPYNARYPKRGAKSDDPTTWSTFALVERSEIMSGSTSTFSPR